MLHLHSCERVAVASRTEVLDLARAIECGGEFNVFCHRPRRFLSGNIISVHERWLITEALRKYVE